MVPPLRTRLFLFNFFYWRPMFDVPSCLSTSPSPLLYGLPPDHPDPFWYDPRPFPPLRHSFRLMSGCFCIFSSNSPRLSPPLLRILSFLNLRCISPYLVPALVDFPYFPLVEIVLFRSFSFPTPFNPPPPFSFSPTIFPCCVALPFRLKRARPKWFSRALSLSSY